MPLVTKFLVLESNATFTGQPKPLYFKEHKQSRFKFVHSKLMHFFLPSRPYKPNEDPFINEFYQRDAMDNALFLAGMEPGDLLITADVDEIPSAHTIRLLQNCDGYPPIMHLQLRNYIYSFEFLVDNNNWRSSVEIFDKKNTSYQHVRKTDYILADAGWHCSFCFRYISDFIFKMQAYSHADRVRYSSFLNPKRIQSIICKGTDLFDMLPEEYTFQELISKLGAVGRSCIGESR
jgi:beta-1,4-mannosyl-glycoprotein beta-1,4-N-acetylglucosaminyltransferase